MGKKKITILRWIFLLVLCPSLKVSEIFKITSYDLAKNIFSVILHFQFLSFWLLISVILHFQFLSFCITNFQSICLYQKTNNMQLHFLLAFTTIFNIHCDHHYIEQTLSDIVILCWGRFDINGDVCLGIDMASLGVWVSVHLCILCTGSDGVSPQRKYHSLSSIWWCILRRRCSIG